MFQHTAARRRLELELIDDFGMVLVSTHSRPKAAGAYIGDNGEITIKFQHTAARRRLD